MKITLAFLCSLMTLGSFAENAQTSFRPDIKLTRDTILQETTSTPNQTENTMNGLFMKGKKALSGKPDYTQSKYPAFKGHWNGFYYGFVNFTNTNYSGYGAESGEFMELDWTHSFVMQFNFCRYSINLVPRNNFGLVCGLGIEYQRLRFENDFSSISLVDHKIQPVDLHENPNISSVKRSTFKTLYLTIPVMLEVQFPASHKNRFYLSGGVMGGVRMHSKTKLIYNDFDGDKHKEKKKGDFNMVPFKADVIARVGYGHINVWGSYTLTDMFKSGKGPELHAYSVGLGLTF